MSEEHSQPDPIADLQQERRELSNQMQKAANSDIHEWVRLFNRAQQVDQQITLLENQEQSANPSNPTGEWSRNSTHPADHSFIPTKK